MEIEKFWMFWVCYICVFVGILSGMILSDSFGNDIVQERDLTASCIQLYGDGFHYEETDTSTIDCVNYQEEWIGNNKIFTETRFVINGSKI